MRVASAIDWAVVSTPATPVSGRSMLYFLSDGLLRSLDSGGIVRTLVNNVDAQTVAGNKTFTGIVAIQATANPAMQFTDSTASRSGRFAFASAAGNFHTAAQQYDTVLRGDAVANDQGIVIAAGPTSTGYARVGAAGVTVGGTLNSTGNLTENGARVYSATSPPPAPANMVTQDTNQTIFGVKTFQNQNLISFVSPALEGNGVGFGRNGVAECYVGLEGTNFSSQFTDRVVGDLSVMGKAGQTVRIGLLGSAPTPLKVTQTAVTAIALYEGANRVYSAANPPPAGGAAATFASSEKWSNV